MARDHFYPPESGRTTTRPPMGDDEFTSSSVAVGSDDMGPDELDSEPGSDPQFLRSPKRVQVRKAGVTRKTANRLRVVVIMVCIASVFGAGTISLYHYATTSWRFRIESSDDIETAGLHRVSRAQVMDILGADIGRNIFRISLEDRKRQLEEIPWVESAAFMRLLPNKLRISVKERTPVAFIHVRNKVALIDANGVVMEMPARSQAKYSFPVITGAADGEPLSTLAARMKIFSALMKDLDSGGANYSKEISEVDLADPDDAKVTVEDPNGALVVHLGSADYLERYKIYTRHVQEWRQQFNKLESVDLRFNGQVIVNADGRSSSKGVSTEGSSARKN